MKKILKLAAIFIDLIFLSSFIIIGYKLIISCPEIIPLKTIIFLLHILYIICFFFVDMLMAIILPSKGSSSVIFYFLLYLTKKTEKKKVKHLQRITMEKKCIIIAVFIDTLILIFTSILYIGIISLAYYWLSCGWSVMIGIVVGFFYLTAICGLITNVIQDVLILLQENYKESDTFGWKIALSLMKKEIKKEEILKNIIYGG